MANRPAMEVASAWEDQLKEGFRDIESSLDVSIDRILDTVMGSASDGVRNSTNQLGFGSRYTWIDG